MSFLPGLINAIGSIGGGIFSRGRGQETPIQGRQRQTIDDLLASLSGGGPYSDLFNPNEEMFQKGFVDPARQRFETQISPQIQQSYISQGQQRGTGIDDTLTRAGVDMNQQLNQIWAGMIDQANNRKFQGINSILGMNQGAQQDQPFGQAFQQAAGGYLSGGGAEDIGSIIGRLLRGSQQQPTPNNQPREGFES